jgi:predicted glycoside hydrolase/deacetylase ChbG (UPF0249 family)
VNRLLIVNADDYGLTEGVSRGILVAHREGIVTSTSVMANGPAFEATARWLDEAPALAIGAHLALVGDQPPLSSPREIPTLCDARGRLPRSWRALVGRIMLGRVDRADLKREAVAQIQRLQSLGRPLTHLDTHQHVHLWPLVGDLVVELARRFGVAAIRVPRSAWRRPAGGAVAALAHLLARKVAAAGLAFTGEFAGFDEAGRMECSRLERTICMLGRRRPASAEICVHPGVSEDPDRSRYRWGYRWPEELHALCAPATRTAIRLAGFDLGTYAELSADTRAA